MGKFWGGVVKSDVLEHKSGNISETREDREKSYYGGPIGSHQCSFEWYYPLPQDWGFIPPSKTSIAIISGTGKATN